MEIVAALSAVGSVLTALFTGWLLYLNRIQYYGEIRIDWKRQSSQSVSGEVSHSIRGTVRNETKHRVTLSHLKISGPFEKVRGGPISGHIYEGDGEILPLVLEVDPATTADFSVQIVPDRKKLQHRMRFFLFKPAWISRLGWKLFGLQTGHGILFSIRAYAQKNHTSIKPMSFKYSFRLGRQQAQDYIDRG